MFREAPGQFAAEGVSPDLVRAGEPRLRTFRVRDTATLQRATAPSRVRRALRTATS